MFKKITILMLLLGSFGNSYGVESTEDFQPHKEPLRHLHDHLLPQEKDLPMFDLLVSFLTRRDVEFEVREHEAEGGSEKIAKILDSDLRQGAKSMLTLSSPPKGEGKDIYTLVVLPGDQTLDMKKLAAFLNIKKTRLAPVPKIEEMTTCVVGSVPPFSFSPEIRLIVDKSLIENEKRIFFSAGRLDRSIFLNITDYLKVTRPFLVDVIKKTL